MGKAEEAVAPRQLADRHAKEDKAWDKVDNANATRRTLISRIHMARQSALHRLEAAGFPGGEIRKIRSNKTRLHVTKKLAGWLLISDPRQINRKHGIYPNIFLMSDGSFTDGWYAARIEDLHVDALTRVLNSLQALGT